MGSIREIGVKIKVLADDLLADWGTVAIVLLACLSAFGLGRISALEAVKPPVAILQAPEAPEPEALYMGGLLVASRSGSAYYYPWCGGADRILPANRVWFESEDAAKRAGYRPAKNCKGLSQ